MRLTNEKFENSNNSYSTFLSDKGELPKLSILDNYKEITRIMTYSYIKGSDYEKKFGNRLASENEKDEEFLKFKEEENNIKKMGTILKSLNHPFPSKGKVSRAYGLTAKSQNGPIKANLPMTGQRHNHSQKQLNQDI